MRKWIHNLLKGMSLTGALFVFQACYGSPPTPFNETGVAPMSFTLVSRESGEALEGITILSKYASHDYAYDEVGRSGADGKCRVELFYGRNEKGPFIRFEDPEGRFAPKDTTLADLRERDVRIQMDPAR